MESGLLNNAFDFIAQRENLALYLSKGNTSAYQDGNLPNGQNRYSIGFGNLATNPIETITYLEAKKRCEDYIIDENSWFSTNWSNYNTLNDNQKVALLSYNYQWGNGNRVFRDRITSGLPINKEWALTLLYSSRRVLEVEKYNLDIQKIDTIAQYFGITILLIIVVVYKIIKG